MYFSRYSNHRLKTCDFSAVCYKFFNENGILIDPYDRSKDDIAIAKQQCMIKNNVIILKYEQYKFYLDYVKEKYGKTYIERFKYKKEGF